MTPEQKQLIEKIWVCVKIWLCVAIIFGMCYISQFVFNMVQVFALSNGTTVEIDTAGLTGLAVVICAYFTTKLVLRDDA